MSNESSNNLQASLSTLILSIGSNAAMSLGLSPHPESGKTSVDIEIARFNIDLLKVIQDKTKNNLSDEEKHLLTNMLSDLQFKFVEVKSNS